LVDEGKLPSVKERVGPEPLVLRGVDGPGRYGGTMLKVVATGGDMQITTSMSAATPLRWSPQGYPVVPHVLKKIDVENNYKTFLLHLRRGIRWSDGHPFTADDILYWWEKESTDTSVRSSPDEIMVYRSHIGELLRIDSFTVEITFPIPNRIFIDRMATWRGLAFCGSPAHYLRQYHPDSTVGDNELCEKTMQKLSLPSRAALYNRIKLWNNPEHPRLWPWIYRSYKPNPPHVFIRNPYYFAVDERGNQLPYIDRLMFREMKRELVTVAAASGEISFQKDMPFNEYTRLMSNRDEYGYDIYHWYNGNSSENLFLPNHNKVVLSHDPSTKKRADMLKNPAFRKALSIAINREKLIQAEFNGLAEPVQIAPVPISPFYNEKLRYAYTAYEPDRANHLLDSIGLVNRDVEGYRTFRDGSRMQFFLNMSGSGGTGSNFAQMVVDDWATVGVRGIVRERARTLFFLTLRSREHDFCVTRMNGKINPLIDPKNYVPLRNSPQAYGYGLWYSMGGLHGDPKAQTSAAVPVPPGHPFRDAMRWLDSAYQAPTLQQQVAAFEHVTDIAAENLWVFNICSSPPHLVVVKRELKNVPRVAFANWDFMTPANAGVETFYFTESNESKGAVAQIKRELTEITPLPNVPESNNAPVRSKRGGSITALLVKVLIWGTVLLFLVLISLKHPFIGRRLLIMVPTLLVVSFFVFTVIQAPPGDYLTSRIIELELRGEAADLRAIEELKSVFHVEDPYLVKYAKWLGLPWFVTFDKKDSGLLQGNMGRSMQDLTPVNDLVGDRLLLTLAISFGTILFTWIVALPIGIYSAVRQYTIGDYIVTFVGFIGMCIPNFLLALLLMYVASKFGISITGLFSAEYAAQPEWSMGKVIDLLKHLWLPVVVIGVNGTAGMIRIMRGNLLDELQKPYVVTARAKGVRPLKLLVKYPVRLALNPFISRIGATFPMLISGGTIVALILSLPTIGPLMLNALMTEDMYLAGSMLMILSLLGIFGTLVSDLLLLALDPRIRMGGGSR
jgi:ABC-type dipeptide/oligopeptide/nickel transport system permease component/ABC-type transport system substrate-binding protein